MGRTPIEEREESAPPKLCVALSLASTGIEWPRWTRIYVEGKTKKGKKELERKERKAKMMDIEMSSNVLQPNPPLTNIFITVSENNNILHRVMWAFLGFSWLGQRFTEKTGNQEPSPTPNPFRRFLPNSPINSHPFLFSLSSFSFSPSFFPHLTFWFFPHLGS